MKIKVGGIYGILNHAFDKTNGRAVYGAVQVLDMDKNGSWIRLKFRRISVGKAEHFQKWAPTALPENKIQELNQINTFIFPYGRELALTLDRVQFLPSQSNPDSLFASNQLYGSERGLINFGKNIDFNQITLEDLESKLGLYKSNVEVQLNDVIGIYLENYSQKTILIIKIVEHEKGISVKYLTKFLYRASAQYENKYK